MNHVVYKLPDGEEITIPDTDAVPDKGQQVELSGRAESFEVEQVRWAVQVYPSTAVQTAIVELGPS